jgi:hypothetical protein
MKRPFLALALTVLTAPVLADGGRLDLPASPQLAARASDSTDITLPGSLFSWLASGESGDPEARKILAHLQAIRIRSYSFDHEHAYDAADVAAVRRQLGAPQWSTIVSAHDRKEDEHSEVYICLQQETACGLAVVVTGPREFTVVNLVGRVPLDEVKAVTRELHLHNGV